MEEKSKEKKINMTDFRNYKNASLTHKTHNILRELSKKLLPGSTLSIAKTIDALAGEKQLQLQKERK